MISKEEKIKVLKKFIYQKGSCHNIDCDRCMNALYDLPCGECLGHHKPTRLITAKKRLAELTGSSSLSFLNEEDLIILNQDI